MLPEFSFLLASNLTLVYEAWLVGEFEGTMVNFGEMLHWLATLIGKYYKDSFT